MSIGKVYALSNESMPGLFKIGMTTNCAETRAKQLSSTTGVPTEFEVVCQVTVNNCGEIEKQIHELLSDSRVNDGREFFKCSADELNHAFGVALRNEQNEHQNGVMFNAASWWFLMAEKLDAEMNANGCDGGDFQYYRSLLQSSLFNAERAAAFFADAVQDGERELLGGIHSSAYRLMELVHDRIQYEGGTESDCQKANFLIADYLERDIVAYDIAQTYIEGMRAVEKETAEERLVRKKIELEDARKGLAALHAAFNVSAKKGDLH